MIIIIRQTRSSNNNSVILTEKQNQVLTDIIKLLDHDDLYNIDTKVPFMVQKIQTLPEEEQETLYIFVSCVQHSLIEIRNFSVNYATRGWFGDFICGAVCSGIGAIHGAVVGAICGGGIVGGAVGTVWGIAEGAAWSATVC